MRLVGLLLLCSLGFCATKVALSLEVQEYWVQKIAHNTIQTVTLFKGDTTHWENPPLHKLTDCAMFLGIGLEYERNLEKRLSSLYPQLRFVRTDEGIRKRPYTGSRTLDPHIWQSITNVRLIAQNTLFALVKLLPQNAGLYRRNFEKFEQDLDLLQRNLDVSLAPLKRREFVVGVPVWGYFAQEFGFIQVPIGNTPRVLNEVGVMVRREKIPFIFSIPSDSVARRVALDWGISVLTIPSADRNWEHNIRRLATALAQAQPK